jgi:hypothetical protein
VLIDRSSAQVDGADQLVHTYAVFVFEQVCQYLFLTVAREDHDPVHSRKFNDWRIASFA